MVPQFFCFLVALGQVSDLAFGAITREHVVRRSGSAETEVFLTNEDFEKSATMTEVDLESLGIAVPNDPILTGNKFEGDIAGFTNNNTRNIFNMTVQRSAVNLASRKWANGIIPYALSSKYGTYSTQLFAKVFREYEQKTCIKFVPKTDAHKDYVFIAPVDGCYSLVGKTGMGRQPISLDEGCISFGTMIHELMHTVGFFHEQSRPDRDDFVQVELKNVASDSLDQFEKYSRRTVDELSLPYDYGSIMHYGPYAFTKNGKRTIKALKTGGDKMGQREGFSSIDLQKINKLYDCKKTISETDDGNGPTSGPDPWNSGAGSSGCEDKKISCKRWAIGGDCENDKVYMRENCAKTCGLCDDGNSRGSATSKTKKPFVTTPPSVEETSRPCENKKYTCIIYARVGYCESDERYMRENCQKSCGFCETGGSSKGTRRKPETAVVFRPDNAVPMASRTTGAPLTTGRPDATPDTSSTCENKYEYSCALFAKLGDCENNSEWMRPRCAKACGFCKSTGSSSITTDRSTLNSKCEDKMSQCEIWSQTGNCESQSEHMRKNCPKTCGVCGQTSSIIETTSSCQDSNPNCPRWASKGYCDKPGFKEYIVLNCPKSCKTCASSRNRTAPRLL